jgi:hypothetical protein
VALPAGAHACATCVCATWSRPTRPERVLRHEHVCLVSL